MRSIDEIHIDHPDDWREECRREGYSAAAIAAYEANYLAALDAVERDITPTLPGRITTPIVVTDEMRSAVRAAVDGGASSVPDIAWETYLPESVVGAALISLIRG